MLVGLKICVSRQTLAFFVIESVIVCPLTLICCESILWRTIFWRVRAICFASAPSQVIPAGALGIPANQEARARPKTGSNLPC